MRKALLITIILIAAALRLIALNNFPAGLNADEASIGYNAYSLLQTGKDEYGNPWPLSFKSFGDFKPGLYFYVTIPFIATLGLNEWAVRLPSAIFGVATVLLIFFLAKEIFQNSWIGLISSLLLAITPWHLHFSRGGWETNMATFFITLGVFLFTKKLLFWSFAAFLISMYAYQSPRLIVPVLILALVLLYKTKIISLVKLAPIFIVLLIPLLMQFMGGEGSARFEGLSFLADSGPISRTNELRGQHDESNNFLSVLLHNKFTAYGQNFLGHYLDHFRPDFLFLRGDPIERNKVPEVGQFYLVTSLFLIMGALALIRAKFQHTKFLLAWVLIAPLASSMTYQTPHALRALNMVIPLVLIMGYGVWVIVNWLKKKWILLILLSLVLLFEFIHYLEIYYVHYPKRYPLAWEYGFREMVEKLVSYEPLYNKVVITDRYDQPYILVLFYKKYDPQKYQPQALLSPRDKFNFGTVRNFDKYSFRSISKEEMQKSQNTLFIGTDQEISDDADIIDQVLSPSGEPVFIFAQKK